MNIHLEYELCHPVEDIVKVWTDPDFLRHQVAALGVHDLRTLSVQDEGDSKIVTTSYVTALQPPGPLARIVPAKVTVTHRDLIGPPDAAGVRRLTWDIGVSSVPLHAGGRNVLRPAADGALFVVDGKARSGAPLLGRRLEKVAHDLVCDIVPKIRDITLDWMSGGRSRSGLGKL
jgi:Protein of unknown function (DUF2505)